MARLAGLRDGTELPQLRARAGVVCSGVSGRAEGSGWRIRADHDYILKNQRNRVVRNHHVDFAFLAEAGVELARGRIERNQPAPRGKQNPRWIAPLAGHIGDAAARDSVYRKTPNLLARFRLERDYAAGGGKIHHIVNDNRRGFGVAATRAVPLRCSRGCIALQAIGPGLLEARGVLHRNLRQRRIARASRIVAVQRPVAAGRFRWLFGHPFLLRAARLC